MSSKLPYFDPKLWMALVYRLDMLEHPTIPLNKLRDNFNLHTTEYVEFDREYLFGGLPTECNCCRNDFLPEDLLIGKTKCVCGWRTCLGCMVRDLSTRYGDYKCPGCKTLSLWMHQGTLQTLRCPELFMELLVSKPSQKIDLDSDEEPGEIVAV